MSRDRVGAWIVIVWVLCAVARPAPSQDAGIAPIVRKAAFSRDGRLGVLVYEGGATLLDFENRRETCVIRERGLGAPAFSTDATELAIAARTYYEDSPIGEIAPFAEIRIIDVRTGAVKKRFADSRVVYVLETAFNPAGELFALGANPGRVVPGRRRGFNQLFLWEVTAGKVTPLLPVSRARRLIRCVAAFPPDADALVVSYGTEEAEEVKIYRTSDPSAARSIARARGVTAPVAPIGFGSLAFSPDARTLAYEVVYVSGLGSRPTGEIRLYNLVNKRIVRRITNVPTSMLSLVFLADGRLAALPSISMQAWLKQRNEWWRFSREIEYLRAVTIWNPSSGRIVRRIGLPDDALVSLPVPQRNAAVSLMDRAWSMFALDSAGIQDSVAAADPECIPALGGRSDPALREALQSFTIHRILAVSFLPGRPGVLMGASDSGLAYFWDTATGNDLHRTRLASSADCIVVSGNGRVLAVAGEER